ncbi:MAG: CIA30 family protein [Candidatus Omnitrophica bacterium]|nr:CIA30 family protein [Candidatus Omnitrophota bacterium]
MTRDEIYDHLAKVYLGKRQDIVEEKKKKTLNQSWMVINVVITTVILISTVYGFTAFLTRRVVFNNQVFYSLTNNPIRIAYDLNDPFPSAKTFSITIPKKDASKYSHLNLTIRGSKEAYPGIVKMVVGNQLNEKATYYIQNVQGGWQKVSISLDKLNLTDWSTVTDVSFVLEAWNVDFKKGVVFIDDVSFSNL